MQNIFLAAVIAYIIALILTPLLIPMLRRLKFGQSIRNEGPARHYAKSGTPTMGGIVIVIALTVATLLFAGSGSEVWLCLFITLGHALIGFIDDFIKVALKRSLGLRAREKLLGQIVMSVALAFYVSTELGLGTDVWIPFAGTFDLGSWYYVLIFFVLVGATNAVNLTDGLDGLAAGTTTIAALAYTVVSLLVLKEPLAIFSAALAGSCVGFLKYNAHPAKVFMGDTGSLALGGALATVAVLTKTELLLVVIGGVFVIEALSVIIQVGSFKLRGKRVFRMSPIHHHFELNGWAEVKVVHRFWLIGIFLAVVAVTILLISRKGGLF